MAAWRARAAAVSLRRGEAAIRGSLHRWRASNQLAVGEQRVVVIRDRAARRARRRV